MIEIRAENAADLAGIRQVHEQAFRPSLMEARLVDLLRQAGAAPISLVALSEHRIVGHILFSPMTIDPAPAGAIRLLGLAPLGVLPAFQKQAIGSALVERGLSDCRQSGCDLVAVLGNPAYYSRFGFGPARVHGLENEYHAGDAFMLMELRPGVLQGIQGLLKYRPEFKQAGA